MPTYVLLMKYHSSGMRAAHEDPGVLTRVNDAVARWEAKVLSSYRLLGDYDQCVIFDAPDNFKAYRATLAQELSTTANRATPKTTELRRTRPRPAGSPRHSAQNEVAR